MSNKPGNGSADPDKKKLPTHREMVRRLTDFAGKADSILEALEQMRLNVVNLKNMGTNLLGDVENMAKAQARAYEDFKKKAGA